VLDLGNRPEWPCAVVFDCDGTLVDTADCVAAASRSVVRRRGRSSEDPEVGLTIPEVAGILSGLLGDSVDELVRELTEEILSGFRRGVALMPGAAWIVRRTAEVVPVAVASNAPRVVLDESLRQSGLLDFIAVVVSADEVPSGKPAPDVYSAACRLLGAKPADVLAVEDSLVGVQAARAAGTTVLGVGDPVLGHQTALYVNQLDDPALVRWVSGWGHHGARTQRPRPR
jgi:HAD superfamily hydrolase (TIGR01509 family)